MDVLARIQEVNRKIDRLAFEVRAQKLLLEQLLLDIRQRRQPVHHERQKYANDFSLRPRLSARKPKRKPAGAAARSSAG